MDVLDPFALVLEHAKENCVALPIIAATNDALLLEAEAEVKTQRSRIIDADQESDAFIFELKKRVREESRKHSASAPVGSVSSQSDFAPDPAVSIVDTPHRDFTVHSGADCLMIPEIFRLHSSNGETGSDKICDTLVFSKDQVMPAGSKIRFELCHDTICALVENLRRMLAQ